MDGGRGCLKCLWSQLDLTAKPFSETTECEGSGIFMTTSGTGPVLLPTLLAPHSVSQGRQLRLHGPLLLAKHVITACPPQAERLRSGAGNPTCLSVNGRGSDPSLVQSRVGHGVEVPGIQVSRVGVKKPRQASWRNLPRNKNPHAAQQLEDPLAYIASQFCPPSSCPHLPGTDGMTQPP